MNNAWEYKILSYETGNCPIYEFKLNELGVEGWEVFFVKEDSRGIDNIYYFKRLKKND